MAIYINISERYGDTVEVTIEDYRELNPNGDFYIFADQIREARSDGGYEVLAYEKASYNDLYGENR